MTAQIYLNNLHHGYMHIKDANLLIFDECHHAVALHPFKQVSKIRSSLIYYKIINSRYMPSVKICTWLVFKIC